MLLSQIFLTSVPPMVQTFRAYQSFPTSPRAPQKQKLTRPLRPQLRKPKARIQAYPTLRRTPMRVIPRTDC